LAAISKKSITVTNVGLNPTRTGFLDILRQFGATVDITERKSISGESRGTVTVTGGTLKGRKIQGEQIVDLIDEIPILSVVAACAEGTTVIRDASELRVKETDRLAAIATNLRAMGVKAGELEDGLAIEGGKQLHGADITTFGDHRIAMAFAIAAQIAAGPSSLDDASCVAISCPTFFDLLSQVSR
jgi:3-phosphoshikimate 1-carboxyvinyltransferase